ncbi:MAG: PAS domain S-box protein [Ignavibacteria bacterium]|nr:PAS domain S-box protein [Ignavibacteria bacterium]
MDIKKIYEKVCNLCTFPIRVTDCNGKVVIVNDSYCHLVDLRRDDIIGNPFWFVYTEAEREEIKKFYLEFLKKGKTYEKTERIVTLKTGEKLFLEGTYTLFETEGEKFILAVFNDITERRKAEELLQESEETFRKLFEDSTDSILLLTSDGFQDCNKATLNIFKYKRKEEIIGKQPWQLSPEFQPDGISSEIKAKQMIEKAGNEGYNCFEWIHKKSNGDEFPCEVLLFPIKIKNIRYYYSIVRDISSRKRIESALRKSEELYKAIFENTGSLTMIVEEDNTIILANNETFPLTGYKPEEIIGTKWMNYVVPESLEMMMKYHKERRIHPDKVPNKYEAKLFNKKGEIRNVLLNVQMIPGTKQSIVSISDITEIKKAEEALKASEQRFRRLAENAEDIIYRYDFYPKMGFTYVSPAATRIIGYTPEEHYADPELGLKIVHPDDRHILQNYFNDKGEFNKTITLRWITKDGRIIWTEQKNIPIYDDNGNLIALEGIARDITERKKTEEALIESERKYRELVNSSPQIIVIHSEGKVCFANQTALKTFGLKSAEDAVGKDIMDFVSPESKKIVEERIKKSLKEKVVSPPVDEKWIKIDGTEFFVNVTAIPITWEGKPAIQVVAIDITDRIKIENELRTSETKYRNLVENALIGVYSTNLAGNFLYANKALCNIFEYDNVEEFMKMNANSFYKNFYDREKIIELLNKYGKVINYEIELITKSGKPIYVLANSFKVGDIITGMMMDITERKRYEQEIIRERERAEEMSRIKSSFLANISHELRTPLQGILGFSEIIQEEDNFNEVRRMARVIHKSGMRLLNTLNQILDLSLLEAKAKTINYKNIDIVSLIKEVMELFQPEAKKKNLKLIFESEYSTLPCSSDVEIITNILNNLISNGIIYTEKGSVKVKLKEEIIDGKEYIIINIIDTGIGIEEKNFDLIFDEFRQVSEGYGRSFEGTGLGLSLCRKYLNLLGGEISVKSKVGVGSDFEVKIPKIYSHEKIDKIESKKLITKKSEIKEIKKPKILLVEDEEDCIILVEYYLSESYFIEIAKTAKEAIEKVKSNEYDLILMDINLGKGMSGMDAVKEIRQLKGYEKIPIIAMTAFAMKGDREEFISGGCDEYISKPFKKEQLEDIIKKLLRKGN